jgi:hypothetical protein
MKLGLTDKQYINLIGLLKEQGETPASEPEKGTSSKQGGGQGYPDVTKWESGVTRGAANQVGVTKWSDVVGSKLNRGKANPLNEQEKTNVSEYYKNYYVLPAAITQETNNGQLIIPKIVDGIKTNITFYKYPLKYGLFWGNLIGTKYEDYVPSEKILMRIIPDGAVQSFQLGKNPEDLYSLNLERTQDPINGKNLEIIGKAYYNKKGKLYISPNIDQKIFDDKPLLDQFLDSERGLLGEFLFVAAAIVAGILTGGIADFAAAGFVGGTEFLGSTAIEFLGEQITTRSIIVLAGESLVWDYKGYREIKNGKPVSGFIDIAFGIIIPLAHDLGLLGRLGIGNVKPEVIDNLGVKLIGMSETELVDVFTKTEIQGGLSDAEKKLFKTIISIPRKEWNGVARDVMLTMEKDLSSNGVKIQSEIGKIIMKYGNRTQKTWYTRLGTAMVHDVFILIPILESLVKSMGLKDIPKSIAIPLIQQYNIAWKTGKENEFLDKIEKDKNNSKTINEFMMRFKSDFNVKSQLNDDQIQSLIDSINQQSTEVKIKNNEK